MGSFDFTCAVSGLPIAGGTPVRLLLLQSSPFGPAGDDVGDGERSWYLRALPVRGQYNDCGSITDVDKRDAAIAQNWLDGLGVDMIEQGWGDNTCQFDELLEALWERQVRVSATLETGQDHKRHAENVPALFAPRKVSRGIPTSAATNRYDPSADPHMGFGGGRAIVTDLDDGVGGPCPYTPDLGETMSRWRERCGYGDDVDVPGEFVWHGGEWWSLNGDGTIGWPYRATWLIDISQLGNEDHKFIVARLRRGEVRVRVGGHSSDIEASIRLTALAKRLARRYSVMLSPGDGHPQLLVHPKPGTRDGEHTFRFAPPSLESRGRSGVPLAQAMVREDVWQALCHTIVDSVGLDASFYERTLGQSAQWREWACRHGTIGSFISQNPSVDGFGMNVSWLLFAGGQRDAADVDNFLDVLAQTVLVSYVLANVRYEWRPVGWTVPQCGDWKAHREFLARLLHIAQEEGQRAQWLAEYRAPRKAERAEVRIALKLVVRCCIQQAENLAAHHVSRPLT